MKVPTPARILLVTGSLLGLPGCLPDRFSPCPMMPQGPTIFITVWDASTGEPVVGGVTGVAVVDDQVIQLEHSGDTEDPNAVWAYGPAGTYDLFLARDGYLAWFKGGVTVTQTRCGVNSVSVKAEMNPLGEGLSNGPLQPPPAPGE